MRLRGIDFGNVLGASGVQGFFGEGYAFHKLEGPLGPKFAGMTFVAKTATLHPRAGNMPLKEDYTPRDLFPGCVRAKPIRGVMLNSVGLSNPGLQALLVTRKWQALKQPFWISIMSLANSTEERMAELHKMVAIIKLAKDSFSVPFGVQINLSCPNTGHDPHELIGESAKALDITQALGVPIMPKYSIASAPIKAIRELESHPGCDAICVSNTIPFGWEGVDWQRVWGSTTSPIAHLGGGGLSGRTLCPLVCKWIATLRAAGFTKPINGGGGILSVEDVERYHDAGASSVFIGSAAVLRPWRVKSIIDKANSLEWR